MKGFWVFWGNVPIIVALNLPGAVPLQRHILMEALYHHRLPISILNTKLRPSRNINGFNLILPEGPTRSLKDFLEKAHSYMLKSRKSILLIKKEELI